MKRLILFMLIGIIGLVMIETISGAVVLGINAGFVTVAPTTDPDGAFGTSIDTKTTASKYVSPMTAEKITEIGWYVAYGSEEAEMQWGLYDNNAVTNDPDNLLYSINSSKGTDAGWKTVSVNWAITENTTYWVAFYVPNTASASSIDGDTVAGEYVDLHKYLLYIPHPTWGTSSTNYVNTLFAVYAVWEPAGEKNPPTYSNIAHSNTDIGVSTTFSSLWNDTTLHPSGQYIFSTNNTGVWVNDSAINFITTPSSANVTKTLNLTEGETIGYRWFVTDNNGNVNNTPIFTLTTTKPTYFGNDYILGADEQKMYNWRNIFGYEVSFVTSDGNWLMQKLFTSWLGIGTTTPTHELNVVGDANITGEVFIGNDLSVTGIINSSGSINSSGNFSGDYFFGDGSQLTGIESGGGDGGWQPNNATENNNYTTTGNLTVNTIYATSNFKVDDANNAICIGTNTGDTNAHITALGWGANLGNNIGYGTFIGKGSGYNNLGTHVTAIGESSGDANEANGDYTTFVGELAGKRNSGTALTAVGYNAGYDNGGGYNTFVGNGVAYRQSGSYVNAIGTSASSRNSGDYLVAIGTSAGYRNNVNNVVAIGYQSGYYNHGQQGTFIGYQSGYENEGDFTFGFGFASAYRNSGEYGTGIGYQSIRENTGDSVIAIGSNVGYKNGGEYAIAIGPEAFNDYVNDFANAEIADVVGATDETVTITGGHSFGVAGEFVNLNVSTNNTMPSGLSAGIHFWEIINASTLHCEDDIWINVGVGTLTLTPRFNYDHTVVIGYDAEPTASNQLVIMDTLINAIPLIKGDFLSGLVNIFSLNITEDAYIGGNVGIGTSTPRYPLEVLGGNATDNNISAYFEKNISATGFITRTSVFDKSKNVWDYIKDADYFTDENGKIEHNKFYGYSSWGAKDINKSVNVNKEVEVCKQIPIMEEVCETKNECNWELDGKYYEEVCEEVEVCKQEQTQTCSDTKEVCNYVEVEDSKELYDNKIMSEKICETVPTNCLLDFEEVCETQIQVEVTYPETIIEEGVELGAEINVNRQGLFEIARDLCIEENDKWNKYDWCDKVSVK